MRVFRTAVILGMLVGVIACRAMSGAVATTPGTPLQVKSVTENMKRLTVLVTDQSSREPPHFGDSASKPFDCTTGLQDGTHCLPSGARASFASALADALKRAGFTVTRNPLDAYEIELVTNVEPVDFSSTGTTSTLRGAAPSEHDSVYFYLVRFGDPMRPGSNQITEGLRKNDSGGWRKIRHWQGDEEYELSSKHAALQSECLDSGDHWYKATTSMVEGFLPWEVAAQVVNAIATCDAFESFAVALNAASGAARPPTAVASEASPASVRPPVATSIPAPPGVPPAATAAAPAPAYSFVVGAPQPAAYALVVGIEHYRDIVAAPGARNDAERFAAMVQKTLGIPESHLRVAVDDHATKTDLETDLAWLKSSVTAGGRIYFFFSGHGAPNTDDTSGGSFLIPYDANAKLLSTTALPVAGVMGTLAASRAKDGLVMLDTCFSGAGGRSILPPGARPLMRVREPQASAQLALFSASGANEISGPAPGENLGLFTKYLTEGLGTGRADADGDGDVSLAELHAYVKPRVERDARRDHREQSPTATVGSNIGGTERFDVAWGFAPR